VSTTTSLALAAAVTVGAPAVMLGWLRLTERALAVLPEARRRRLRPWLWLFFPLTAGGVYLVWPLFYTVVISFQVTPRHGQTHAGLGNYRHLWASHEVHAALLNNALWLVGLVSGALILGLLVAMLANAVRWEPIAKSIIVMPMAISAVAGGVVWRFMYDYKPPGLPQTGTLNAVWVFATGRQPVAWLVNAATNNAALIVVGVWMSVGLVTVILSAAIKAIPLELVEAGRLDGARPLQLFRYVLLPQLLPTIVVVGTLLAITALKAFDVVYVMTNGNFGTDVLANLMYRELFLNSDHGRAAAIAVLIVVLVSPVIVVNLRVYRAERSS
jgi:alpha-glucoside transport system permease protein